MVISAKEVITHTWKFLVLLAVNIWSTTYEHPIFAGMFFFLLLLYKYLPYLFSFLVLCSPVIICAGLLLGILLSYDQPIYPGTDDDDRTAIKELISSHNVYHAFQEEEDKRQEPITNTQVLEDSTTAQGSLGLIDHQDVSESESDYDSESDSDHAESSSPDASMTDIIPMLYELHSLLDSEDPHPLNNAPNDIRSASGTSMEESESDEEAENTEEGLDEETEEKNGDEAELAVKWTEDDEKNVIVLGTSELERNERVENLIAKRRARKSIFESERNLIDLDGGEIISSTNWVSNFQAQIHPISVPRHNPFDLPSDSEEACGLHPIPGSAPSVLLPRQNPFDDPQGSTFEGGNFSGFSGNSQGFVGFHHREVLFRRHESFAHVAPFASDVRFIPYFVTERASSENPSFAHLQRQSSEKSDDFKESSSRDSEPSSSENEPSGKKLDLETEFGLNSASKASEEEKSSSDESDSVDSEALDRSSNENVDEDIQHERDAPKSSDLTLETGEDSSGESTRSLKSVSVEEEIENDVEPVYDLSPSAVEKLRAQVASFGKEFLHIATDSLKPSSSRRVQAIDSSSKIGMTPNLSSVEKNENESKSSDVGEIRHRDVIHVEHPEDKDEYEYVEKTMSRSSSASLESDTTEGIELDVQINQKLTGRRNANANDVHPSHESSIIQEHEYENVSGSGKYIEKNEPHREKNPDAKRAGDQALLSELDKVGDFCGHELQPNEQKADVCNQGVEARPFLDVSASSRRYVNNRVDLTDADSDVDVSVKHKSTSSSAKSKNKNKSHESLSSSSSSSSSSDSD